MRTCSYCGDSNKKSVTQCHGCGAPLPAIEEEPAPSVHINYVVHKQSQAQYVVETRQPIVQPVGPPVSRYNNGLLIVLGVLIGIPTLMIGGCMLIAVAVGSRSSSHIDSRNSNSVSGGAGKAENEIGWHVTEFNSGATWVMLTAPRLSEGPDEFSPLINFICSAGELKGAAVGIGSKQSIMASKSRSHTVRYSFDNGPVIIQKWQTSLADSLDAPNPKLFLKTVRKSKTFKFWYEPNTSYYL